MSYALDAASRLHERQVEAATRVQDLMVKAVDSLVSLRNKAPEPPERVVAPLEKISGPVSKVIGSPSEFASYVARSTREWTELQQKFQESIISVALPKEEASTAKPKAKTVKATTS